jgi:tetrahydromethanopterin S-methyltransferase subunit G
VTVQGFEERASKLEADIADAHKRAKELEGKVGAPFEHEKRYEQLSRRQSEIEEKLDLTKNQAPSQADATTDDEVQEKATERQTPAEHAHHRKRAAVRV